MVPLYNLAPFYLGLSSFFSRALRTCGAHIFLLFLSCPKHTWSPHQARSRHFLEFTQEENEFVHKTKRMRVECFRNQPMFIFKKSFKSNSWKTYGIFLGGKHPQNGEDSLVTTTLTASRNGRNLILNENEALNPRAKN